MGKFRIPIMTNFLNWDQARGYPVTEQVVRGQEHFASLASGFSFLSAAAHFIVLLTFNRYLADLRLGINRYRWIEYALSSSLMIVLIAQLYGAYDVTFLFVLGCLNATMNLFGYMQELINMHTTKVDWTAYFFGWFAGLAPWAAMFSYVGGVSDTSRIPAFVWAILFSYLVLFMSFAVNMALFYLRIGWFGDKYHGFQRGGYLFCERCYQIQSLVAKSLLIWLVIGGTNQPSSSTYTG